MRVKNARKSAAPKSGSSPLPHKIAVQSRKATESDNYPPYIKEATRQPTNHLAAKKTRCVSIKPTLWLAKVHIFHEKTK